MKCKACIMAAMVFASAGAVAAPAGGDPRGRGPEHERRPDAPMQAPNEHDARAARLTPDELRQLRQDVRNAGREVYGNNRQQRRF